MGCTIEPSSGARYSGRTLEAYRHDLRVFFQWAADSDLEALAATRPHIEAFRSWMEKRGCGTDRLPRDLTDAQLDAAPVLGSIDALLVDDLTDDEDDAFAAALTT